MNIHLIVISRLQSQLDWNQWHWIVLNWMHLNVSTKITTGDFKVTRLFRLLICTQLKEKLPRKWRPRFKPLSSLWSRSLKVDGTIQASKIKCSHLLQIKPDLICYWPTNSLCDQQNVWLNNNQGCCWRGRMSNTKLWKHFKLTSFSSSFLLSDAFIKLEFVTARLVLATNLSSSCRRVEAKAGIESLIRDLLICLSPNGVFSASDCGFSTVRLSSQLVNAV